jgi:cytoskeletal protein CcmA (bactofilin family)
MVASTKPTTAFSPEMPRRVTDVPNPSRRRVTEIESDSVPATVVAPYSDIDRRLIVGRDISLTGEINSCHHLMVEGSIEAKLKDCRIIEVAEGGVFKGSAEIDEAEIGGRFDGDLSVRGRLRVRGSGVISGSIRYGELEVETGGRLIGTVEPLDPKEVMHRVSSTILPDSKLAQSLNETESK